MSAARLVTSLPAVSPDSLWRRGQAPRAFPFCDSRTRFFYLGRGAVWHAVRLLGLSGREVLVPAYHHGVEIEALRDAGAIPVFYGVRRDLMLDLADLVSRIVPRTAAIYVTHFAGFPQPMAEVLSVARAKQLKVIEDCALSLFSSDGPIALGSRADASIFCLYKTLPVPHGGALWMPGGWDGRALEGIGALTSTHQIASSLLMRFERHSGVGRLVRGAAQGIARMMRSLRPLPVDERPVGHRDFRPGQQHLDISPLALRVADSIDAREVVRRRRQNYLALAMRLRDVLPPLVPILAPGVSPLFYPAWCEDKKRLHASLLDMGIEAIDFWSEGSSLVEKGAFPEVDALRAHVIELPIHQDLDDSDLERIADGVRRALGRGA